MAGRIQGFESLPVKPFEKILLTTHCAGDFTKLLNHCDMD